MAGESDLLTKAQSFYQRLSEEERSIVDKLREFQVAGAWEQLFFRDKEIVAKLLKPRIVNYLVAVDVLTTMQKMRELLDINLKIAKGRNTTQRIKISATNAATEVAKAYSYLMNNIINNTQREVEDDKFQAPKRPGFYEDTPPAVTPATNGNGNTEPKSSP